MTASGLTRRLGLAGALVAVAVFAAAAVAGCTSRAQTGTGEPAAAAPVLRISAATSLKDVLEKVAPEFEEANDAMVVFNFGASGQLQKQIEGGAPADVFLSASPRQIDALIGAGLISAEETSAFAGNDLVIFVPKGNEAGIDGPGDLAKADRLVTGDPDTAPHGAKAKEWLNGLGTWATLEPKFVFAENAAQTLDYVARGEVDAGIGFESETTGRDDVEVAYLVPGDQITPIAYVGAPLASSERQELAAAFMDFLLAEESQSAMGGAGFNRAPAPLP